MLRIISSIIWAFATILIITSGVYFTYKLRFIQFNFKNMFKYLLKKGNTNITPFKSLMMTLGSRIGVGSIAGVALSIYLGGIGSIFWMWISAFLGATTTFGETYLGILYREKDKDGYKGGPSYYMKNGLNKYSLGFIYAIMIIVSYIGGFVSIQSNTITKSINQIIKINPIIIGIILCLVTSIIIFGGLKKIINVISKLVPIVTIIYLVITFYIIIGNFNIIPNIFINIIKSAFDFKSIIFGFIPTLIIGMQRGIFSNEAGLGTGSISSSTSGYDSAVGNSYVQMLGIYITTLLICTATALVILTTNYLSLNLNNINGIELTQYAYYYHLGEFGNYFIFIIILLFSFSTILTGYYDGEISLKYILKKQKKRYFLILKIISLIILFIGCIESPQVIWNMIDIIVGILSIMNIYALLSLRKKIKV